MNKQERIIISAYTGVVMCKFEDIHRYIQKKLGRPILTHELALDNIEEEIREKTRDDFLSLCGDD